MCEFSLAVKKTESRPEVKFRFETGEVEEINYEIRKRGVFGEAAEDGSYNMLQQLLLLAPLFSFDSFTESYNCVSRCN